MPASGHPKGPRDTRRLVLQSQTGVRASAATVPYPLHRPVRAVRVLGPLRRTPIATNGTVLGQASAA